MAPGPGTRFIKQRGAKETLSCPCFSAWAFTIPFAQLDERLRPEDKLFAFLDDVHVVSPPHRTQDGYNILEEQLWTGAGIQFHTGKTRVWNREGTCPPGVGELGEGPSGIKIFGTPIVSPEFVRTIIAKRLEDEGRLWDAVAWVPDLQCSWQILLQCAGPRCHHLLRTLPPRQSAEYAQCHDDGMMRVMDGLMEGLTGTGEEKTEAHQLASLPMRLGGLGLRSAVRMAPAAFFASWAHALHCGEIGRRARRWWMPFGVAKGGRQARSARIWDLQSGGRPPPSTLTEPGEWAHGWQFYASSVSEHHFRKTVVLPSHVPATRHT